jgi:O-antigen biosynthesis protein
MGLDRSTRDCSAVTGACLLTRRLLFEEMNGFDEVEFPVNLQDVDYCLRVWAGGHRIVYVAEAELTHHESATRKRINATAREIAVFRERWQRWLDDDPYYNPNLTRSAEDFSVGLE